LYVLFNNYHAIPLIFYVLLSVHLDNLYNENQLDALLRLNLFRHITSTFLGVFIAHHQEVFTVYVQQLVRVIHLGDW
jgi:hypothetical protein